MFSLFILMLVSGLGLLILSAVLYIVWGISDVIDELSGKKRKRQIEKLQKASMAIGVTDSVASTTQLFRDSEEDEELAELIQNASNSYFSSTSTSSNIVDDSATDFIADGSESEVTDFSSKSGNLSDFKNITILEEITNLEEVINVKSKVNN